MSLQEIKVSREEVLKIVTENKEKHDFILKDSINGYWMEAEAFLKKNEKEKLEIINKNHRESLKKLRKEKKVAIKLLKENTKKDLATVKAKDRSKGFHYWNGNYPEDHGDDYKGTIRRLELCIENEIKLDSNEFDAYIRNKWTWRDSFINSNTRYVNSYYENFSPYLQCSASWATQSVSSSLSISGSFWGTGSLSTF